MIRAFRTAHQAFRGKTRMIENYMKDGKAPELKLPEDLAMMRSMVRSALGDKPISVRMVALFSLTATVTSGVVSTVTIGGVSAALITSSFNENSSLTALFDEVKATHGHVEFALFCTSAGGSSVGSAAVDSNLHRIAYDPMEASAPASAVVAAESQQQKAIAPATVYEASPSVAASSHTNEVHRFEFKMPPGDVIPASGASSGQAVGSAWQDSALPSPVGYLRYYGVGKNVNAVKVADGIVVLNTLWRCRDA